jgi:exonuclease III
MKIVSFNINNINRRYAPNGNPQPGPKFDYKLAWLKRLNAHAAELYATGAPSCWREITTLFRQTSTSIDEVLGS